MRRSARVNFVRQQGFTHESAPACALRYSPLMFQPRAVGVLVVLGLLLQAWWFFGVLGAVLWWSALLPRWNPFDGLYNAVAGRGEGPTLDPAPGPRRFAQGLAGTMMLVIAGALLAGWTLVAWIVEGLLVAAVAALVFGRLCVGSYLFLLLRGKGEIARRTAPWASSE